MESPQAKRAPFPTIFIITIVLTSLFTGGLLGYLAGNSFTSRRIDDLQSQLSALQEQLGNFQSTPDVTSQNITHILGEIVNLQSQLLTIQEQLNKLRATPNVADQNTAREIISLQNQLSTIQEQIRQLQATASITYILWQNVSLSELYEQVKASVVVIQGLIKPPGQTYYTQVQGSGFIYNFTGQMVILTNYHVVSGATNITVTFINGNRYAALVLGSNPYTDFAVLSTSAPPEEYKPLEIVTSSTLRVGDPVIVVGTPYGLAGSMSEGIVSALNRTLIINGYSITNVIQTTAPLNPGNSGSPLMNYYGQVVGITTAIIQESQGIGFAIPSDIILAEIERIITG